jgi:hypothetical protein
VNTRAPVFLVHSGAGRAPEQGRVTTRIDTLVLRGFPPMIPARVEEAFTAELARLLGGAASRLPEWAARRADELPALRLKFRVRPTAQTVGRELARAIFKRITGSEEVHS